jgi:hypothetical protein
MVTRQADLVRSDGIRGVQEGTRSEENDRVLFDLMLDFHGLW